MDKVKPFIGLALAAQIIAIILLASGAFALRVLYNETAELNASGLDHAWYGYNGDQRLNKNSTRSYTGSYSLEADADVSPNSYNMSWLLANVTSNESLNFTFAYFPVDKEARFFFTNVSRCSDVDETHGRGLGMGVLYNDNTLLERYPGQNSIGATSLLNSWQKYEMILYVNATNGEYHYNLSRNQTLLAHSISPMDGGGAQENVTTIGCIKASPGAGNAAFWMDDLLIINMSAGGEAGDPPPNITQESYNVTSAYANQTAWRNDTQDVCRVQQDTTPTVTFTLTEAGNCTIGENNFNYSKMKLNDSDTLCSTLETTSMSCTLPASQAISAGRQDIFISCIDLSRNEFENSTSGPLRISLDFLMSGTITHPDGTPYPGADVVVMDSFNNTKEANATSNITGRWNLYVPDAGNYTVYAFNASNSSLNANITAFVEVFR